MDIILLINEIIGVVFVSVMISFLSILIISILFEIVAYFIKSIYLEVSLFKMILKKHPNIVKFSSFIFIFIIFILPAFIKYLFRYNKNEYNYWGNYLSNILGAVITIVIYICTLIKQHNDDMKSLKLFAKRQLEHEMFSDFNRANILTSLSNSFQDEIEQQLLNGYLITDRKDIKTLILLHHRDENLHTEFLINNQFSIKLNSYIAIAPNILNKYCDDYNIPHINTIKRIINKNRDEFLIKIESIDDISAHLREITKLSECNKKIGISNSKLVFIRNRLNCLKLSIINVDLCLKIFLLIYRYVFHLPKQITYKYFIKNYSSYKILIENNNKLIK